MLSNNFYALVITFIVALAWLRLNDFTAQRGWISSRISRKIIHMGTGPLFVLCWPLFTNSPASAIWLPSCRSYYSSILPSWFGLLHDEALAIHVALKSVRSYEALYYGIVLLRSPSYIGMDRQLE
jgi:phytol kinase